MNKSYAQAKPCKWVVQMELTLGRDLVLNSPHSHGLDLRRGHCPSSSMIGDGSYIHMVSMPWTLEQESWNSQGMNPNCRVMRF
jgi:hypothetical protein